MSKERINCRSCRFYRMFFDKSMQRYIYIAKFEIWRHYLEKSSQSVASERRQFCSIGMYIGHFKTCTTKIKIELSAKLKLPGLLDKSNRSDDCYAGLVPVSTDL